jgi:hypothetical protein
LILSAVTVTRGAPRRLLRSSSHGKWNGTPTALFTDGRGVWDRRHSRAKTAVLSAVGLPETALNRRMRVVQQAAQTPQPSLARHHFHASGAAFNLPHGTASQCDKSPCQAGAPMVQKTVR